MTSEQYIKRIERMAAEMRRLETTNRQLQEENRQLSGGGDSVLMAPRDLCSPRSDATKSPQSVVRSPRGEQRRLEEVNAAYSVKLQHDARRQVEELAALDQASLAHMYARGEAFFDVIVTFSGIEHGK